MKCKTNGVQVLGYYTGEDGCYEIDPDYASVVLSIFQKYDAGVPQKEIIDDLNARGFRTTRGFAFNKKCDQDPEEPEVYRRVFLGRCYCSGRYAADRPAAIV